MAFSPYRKRPLRNQPTTWKRTWKDCTSTYWRSRLPVPQRSRAPLTENPWKQNQLTTSQPLRTPLRHTTSEQSKQQQPSLRDPGWHGLKGVTPKRRSKWVSSFRDGEATIGQVHNHRELHSRLLTVYDVWE